MHIYSFIPLRVMYISYTVYELQAKSSISMNMATLLILLLFVYIGSGTLLLLLQLNNIHRSSFFNCRMHYSHICGNRYFFNSFQFRLRCLPMYISLGTITILWSVLGFLFCFFLLNSFFSLYLPLSHFSLPIIRFE